MLNIAGYPGGRSFIVKEILQLLPPHKVYIEVFGGLAPVLLNKKPSMVEIYNDIDNRLVNMLVQIRDRSEEFAKMIESTPYSTAIYRNYMKIFYSEEYSKLDDFNKAWIMFYLIATSFNGMIGAGMRLSLARNEAKRFHNKAEKMKMIAKRLRYVTFTDMDYKQVFEKWGDRNVLMFMDPPYIDVDQYYGKAWRTADHIELANRIKSLKCDWILVYNDHPTIRQLYRGYNMKVVEQSSMMEKVEQGEERTVKQYLIIWRTKHGLQSL